MQVTSLALQNFRSYEKQTFELSLQTTLIVGKNGVGKTNILEALFTLATGKSFRADSDREMIRWDGEISSVKCQVSGDTELQLMITNGEAYGQKVATKKYLVNGVARRQIDFVGNLRVVLFWPEDLQLVTSSPSRRRKYLDSVLVQVDREYRRNLLSYERGLRQRNRLLDLISEGKANRNQLLFWNQLLIKAGNYLTDKRQEFIDFINKYQVSGVTYQLKYDQSIISELRLDQYKDEEVAAKATLVGPHRDDFIFKFKVEKLKVNDVIELGKFGSRGEQRLGVLWLKMAELAFIENKTGDRPVLLLDDILSELDDEHRELVLNLVDKQQTIITSADLESISEVERARMQMVRL